MSGCVDDSGEVTPKGRHIARHVIDNIARNKKGHYFNWSYIDTVIDNTKIPAIQPDGRIIYIYRQPSRAKFYSIVIIENGDCVVTAIRDLTKIALTNMANKNDWLGFGY